jgi:hypothetical protein
MAGEAAAGQAAVTRNRFIRLSEGTKTVNRVLKARAGNLAGPKGGTSPDDGNDAIDRIHQHRSAH